jgi:hypothetical protein
MKTVVVGGHSRNVGKTSVMQGLLRGLGSLAWTAVKITQHAHGVSTLAGKPCGSTPATRNFVLTDERDPRGRGDSSRYLAAGARRSLWLRVREGRLADAFPALRKALGRDEFVMIESNRVLGVLKPAVYVVVLNRLKRDFKASARQFLKRADALVPVGPLPERSAWPALGAPPFEGKRVFPVSRRSYFNPALCRFVRQRLEQSDAERAPRSRRVQSKRRSNRGCTEQSRNTRAR